MQPSIDIEGFKVVKSSWNQETYPDFFRETYIAEAYKIYHQRR